MKMMKKSSSNTLLNESIKQLEIKRAQELILLKAQFHEVHESLKPVNMIKDSFMTMTASNNLKAGVGKTVLGLVSGFVIKKIIFRNPHTLMLKAASILLQTATVGLVANNSNKISSMGRKLLNTVFSKFRH